MGSSEQCDCLHAGEIYCTVYAQERVMQSDFPSLYTTQNQDLLNSSDEFALRLYTGSKRAFPSVSRCQTLGRTCITVRRLMMRNIGRVRIPSLYSDFSLQRYTNPVGFDANVYAWQDVLRKAAWEGLMPSDGPGADILSLVVGEELLAALETVDWGRPQALGTVIVGTLFSWFLFDWFVSRVGGAGSQLFRRTD